MSDQEPKEEWFNKPGQGNKPGRHGGRSGIAQRAADLKTKVELGMQLDKEGAELDGLDPYKFLRKKGGESPEPNTSTDVVPPDASLDKTEQ